MGFWDSFNKALADGQKETTERQSRSHYKTQTQQENEHYQELASLGDGTLLNKLKKQSLTSQEDKKIIWKILQSRGYTYDRETGRMDRP